MDWSKTAPKRKQKRPADHAGDFDDKVCGWRLCSQHHLALACNTPMLSCCGWAHRGWPLAPLMAWSALVVRLLQKQDTRTKEYEVERHALFFTDKDARRIYKESVKYTLTRRSTLTGRAYRDDPTIMAWGLLNEPRCETWKVPPPPRCLRMLGCQCGCLAQVSTTPR